uniref:Uncharacterized protein n=1 Tax=Tetraselmis sp. GSL018 TaxID=582737 RepID=A0A061RCA9_9CHLO
MEAWKGRGQNLGGNGFSPAANRSFAGSDTPTGAFLTASFTGLKDVLHGSRGDG